MSFFVHIGISISRQNLESGHRVTQGKPGPGANPSIPPPSPSHPPTQLSPGQRPSTGRGIP